jgi:hypothetical protein
MGRKRKWDIGDHYNGWSILSADPYITPNGSHRYQIKVKCDKCGYVKTTTASPTQLTHTGCPHKGMGIRKVRSYTRVYKPSGENLTNKVMFKVDDFTLDEIELRSKQMKVSRSGLIRIALKEFLKIGG